jgi:predicted phage terminase large subunit-like protein
VNRRGFLTTTAGSLATAALPLDQLWLRSLSEELKADAKEDRAENRLTLLAFIEQAWHLVEPESAFVPNWHIDALCQHLEAVSRGEILNLIINVPPGCAKSLIVSVFWPAWEWTQHPELRYLCASYDQALATRDNLRVRNIIESEWYHSRYPRLQLAGDQNQKTRFNTTRGGWRLATSVGGKATGEHPHRKIIDDPHNVKRAESDTDREAVRQWFDLTVSTRGVALKAATVIVMQRLHEDDLSGHVLSTARSKWVHLCLPMRFETGRMPATPIGWNDPRTTPGALLWPALFPEQSVTDLATALGAYGEAGQLQQRPAPAKGGIFERGWFEVIEAMPADDPVVASCRFWDAAGTEGAGDYTAGVRMDKTRKGLFILDADALVHGQWASSAVDSIMQTTAQTDGRHVAIREEQEPGSSGKAVIRSHTLMLPGYDYRGLPATGEKSTRWRPMAAQARVKNIKILATTEAGRIAAKGLIDEFCLAPNAKHDDRTDAAAGAFNELALAANTFQAVRVYA